MAYGEKHGWTRWQMAVAIQRNCGCSLLKGQRLARLWTLEEMVKEAIRTADLAGLPRPSLTTQRVCHWEAGERPKAAYLDLLCRLYQTRPDRLGYGGDHTPVEDQEPAVTVVLPPALARARRGLPEEADGQPDPGENEARRRTLLQASVGNRGVLSAALLDVVDSIRREGEQVFEKTALTVASLERLEENTIPHGAAHLTSAPITVLCDVAVDYMDVKHALEGRLAADLRQRLCRIAAQLAGLVGLVLADFARFSQARTWFFLSRQAADEYGDRALRAWVRAIETFEPFFLGDYPRTIAFAQQARALSRQAATPGSVLGYVMEARALAVMGRNSDALAALRHGDEGYERLDAQLTDNSWLGYPRAAYLCHRAAILTRLGMNALAYKALGEAADAYSPSAVRGRAYVDFCRAMCDIGDGQVADGCGRTVTILLDVPVEQRVALVKARAKEVLDAVPPEARNGRATRELKDVLRGM